MGEVYRARELDLERDVALKVISARHDDDPGFAESFAQEARTIASVEHPNIVPIYACGVEEDTPWMSMRLVTGGSLADRLRQGPLSRPQSIAVIQSVAEALDYAHAQGVIHRDIKPGNVLFDTAGRCYVADFGLAKIVGSTSLIQVSTVAGTPHFMAPEQIKALPLNHRCDIYALGVMAYLLLAGNLPFAGDSHIGIWRKHLDEPPPPVPEDRVPASLMTPVLKALEKAPEDRYSSATAFASEFGKDGSWNKSTIVVQSTSQSPPGRRNLRIGFVAAAVIASATGTWIAVGGFSSLRDRVGFGDSAVLMESISGDVPVPPAPEPEQTDAIAADSAAWDAFQTDMVEQNAARLSLDVSTDLTPSEKSATWRQFLAAFGQQNPYSEEDDRLRAYAETRVVFWETPPDPAEDASLSLAGTLNPPDTSLEAEQVRLSLDQAQRLFSAGSYEAAVTAFEAVLVLDTSNTTARNGVTAARQRAQLEAETQRAEQALDAGNLDEAARAYDAALVFDPANPTALAGLDRVRPPANPTAAQMWVSPVDGREMRWVPAGESQMGSPGAEPDRDPDETQHQIQFTDGYWLDAGEVTYREYRRFVVANPAWTKDNIEPRFHDGNYLADWSGNEFPAGRAGSPVVNVSWHAARAFAAWAGKRLPTETEWEYACRAGTTTTFWWGDTFDPSRAGVEPGAPADRRNAWGLADMIGGIWEWTASIYQPYPYQASGRSEDPANTAPRAIRGGASVNDVRMLRVANRNSDVPERCSNLVGFRCAR